MAFGPVGDLSSLNGNQAFSFLGCSAFTGAAGEVRFGFVDGDA